MKLLLGSQYALRGWKKMPRVLFNIEKNRAVKDLTPAQFITLKNCDGVQDLEINDFLQKLLDVCRAPAYGFTEDFFGKDISKCEFFKGEYDKKIINLFNKYNSSL